MSLVYSPGTLVSFECDDALDDVGYVMYLKSTGHIGKCAAGAVPIGVNFKDTKNRITEVAESGRQVPVQMDGVAVVQYYLAAGDDDINAGDLVMAHQSQPGYVTKFTEDDLSATFSDTETEAAIKKSMYIVGIALEGAAAPASGSTTGKIKVLLRCGRR